MNPTAYFPQRYPDELVYSLLARYAAHNGYPAEAYINEILFAKRSVVASFDLIGHIDTLVSRLPKGLGVTEDSILNKMSLFRFYTIYQPPEIAESAAQDLRTGKVSNLHLKLGINTFKLGRSTRLKYCPLCSQEMLDEYGEMYWRLSHQLPGIKICADHEIFLVDSSVDIIQQGRHFRIAANTFNCPVDVVTVSEKPPPRLIEIAQLMSVILIDPPAGRSFNGWSIYYRKRMIALGMAKSASTMNQKKLQSWFLDFYKPLATQLSLIQDLESGKSSWLSAMVRQHRRAFHPLQHLLLENFLNHVPALESPVGIGPWPCINPLANHGQEHPITRYERHWNHGRVVFTFSCSCGHVYTRNFNPVDGHLGKPRLLRFGGEILAYLDVQIKRGASLRAIARALRIDPKSVIHLATLHGIQTPWKTYQPLASIKPAVVERQDPIEESLVSTKPTKSKIDWAAIDKHHQLAAIQAIKDMTITTPQKRITFAAIEKVIAKRGWLAKRKNKLPETIRTIEALMDCKVSYRARKRDWAQELLSSKGEQPSEWKVERLAGSNWARSRRAHVNLHFMLRGK